MKGNLRLAVWPKPAILEVPLVTIERAVLARLQPPLSLKDVMTPWTSSIKQARKVLAEQARVWKP